MDTEGKAKALQKTKSMAKVRQLIKFILFNLLVVMVVFILCEGLASITFFIQELRETKPVAERLHTRYDPELGWVNIPNTDIEDMYGPGLHMRINSQGFRNDKDFSVEIPAGKVRFICSGDSFTFGFGVSNDQTWCHVLSTLDQRLETVNMAQGGYGIDQAYLWYKRDGDKLAHNVQLFAFITTDFDRMQRDKFLGYGKPVLKVEDGELVVDNVPVSRRAFFVPWATQHQNAINELRSVQFLKETFFQGSAASPKPELDEPTIITLSWHVLKELQQINQARGSKLVLVYLPTQADYKGDDSAIKTDTRRRYVRQAAAEAGLLFIDLVDEFRQLSRDEMNALFIPNGAIDFPGAAGHYSAKGNEYIAHRLYQELLAQPEISNMLEQKAEVISRSP